MATWDQNGHVLDDVTCPVFLFGTDYTLSLHFQNLQNCLELQKNIKYNRKKTSVYHTVNSDRALFHASKTAKIIKVILLSSTLTFCQSALSNITFMIFAVFDVCNNAESPLTVCYLNFSFLPRDALQCKARYCHRMSSVCLSVCL